MSPSLTEGRVKSGATSPISAAIYFHLSTDDLVMILILAHSGWTGEIIPHNRSPDDWPVCYVFAISQPLSGTPCLPARIPIPVLYWECNSGGGTAKRETRGRGSGSSL